MTRQNWTLVIVKPEDRVRGWAVTVGHMGIPGIEEIEVRKTSVPGRYFAIESCTEDTSVTIEYVLGENFFTEKWGAIRALGQRCEEAKLHFEMAIAALDETIRDVAQWMVVHEGSKDLEGEGRDGIR